MSVQYIDTNPSEQLGYPAMLRVIIERSLVAFGDYQLRTGAINTYAALAGVNWLTGVEGVPNVVSGQSAVAIDVQATQQGAHNTVGDVVTLFDSASYLTRVRSVQRIAPYQPWGEQAASAAQQRDAAQAHAEQQQEKDNPLHQAGGELKKLAVVAVVLAVLIGWRELRDMIP